MEQVGRILFGGIHGLYQVIGDATYNTRKKIIRLLRIRTDTSAYKIFQGVCIFALVDFAWIFFRAGSVMTAFSYIYHMFATFDIKVLFNQGLYAMGLDYKEVYLLIFLIMCLCIISMVQKRLIIRNWVANQNTMFRWIIYLASIFIILLWGIYGEDYQQIQFIYFQF